MDLDFDNQPSGPPELFWDVRKVLIATVLFAFFGFFAGWITFFAMTLGFNVAKSRAEFWLYLIPGGLTAFAFFSALFFAHRERRRLLDYYRRDDD
ncbi:MAG: hypothetical protein QNJ30_26765 [Kiloniellales bacterium]|nr:hypothetical protein [Kiloniellales bacterium]